LQRAELLFRQGIRAGEDHAQARESWHKAAFEYQMLVDAGYDHPDLFLNLGNAHFLADELPEAVFAYRRGLRRHPLHPQLWENLAAARDLVGYTDGALRHRPDGDDWPPWLPRPTPAFLLSSALVLHGSGWVAIGGWLVWRRRSAAIIALLLFLAAGVAAGWWSYLDYRIALDEQHPLVVVAVNGAALRRGNGSMYPRHPELPTVNRGMEGRLHGQRGGWVQVQFPAGEIGWLPRGVVLVD